MQNISKPFFVAGSLVVVAILAVIAFGFFGVHTLFIDDEVNDADPFAVAAADIPVDEIDEARSTTTLDGTDDGTDDGTNDDAEPDRPTTTTTTPEATAPEVVTVSSGTFVDGDHPTSGIAVTITDGTRTFLRFEDFETDNGPDLNVYLRSSADQDDVLDLGDLRGNIGDQNYELPADIDLDRYDLVDIWCVRFGVSFGTAALDR